MGSTQYITSNLICKILFRIAYNGVNGLFEVNIYFFTARAIWDVLQVSEGVVNTCLSDHNLLSD